MSTPTILRDAIVRAIENYDRAVEGPPGMVSVDGRLVSRIEAAIDEYLGEVEAERDRLRAREEHFAKALQVADGGQWRNDWDAAIRRVVDVRDRLRAFAREVLADFAEGGLEGPDLQEIGEKHGLLRCEIRHEPCCEGCRCAETEGPEEFEDGVVCYRPTGLLTGKEG